MSSLKRFLCLTGALSSLTGLVQASPVERDTDNLPISISIPLLPLPTPTPWKPEPSSYSSWGPTPSTCPTVTTTVTVTASCTTSPTPSPSAPAFDCPREGYNIRPDGSTVLEAIDLVTGEATTIISSVGGGSGTGINAIGYNVLDNTFYARTLDNGTVIHIFRDGSIEGLSASVADANLGDVDLNGHYWASAGGTQWWEYEVDPASPSYGSLVNSGTSDAPPDGVNVNDWATVPATGPYFYSLVVNGTTGGSAIVRWNSDTHVWERFSNYPDIVVDVWGAAWGENNGTLYGTDNTRGTIWNFPLVGNGEPFVVSQGPTTGSTDAARCVLNVTP